LYVYTLKIEKAYGKTSSFIKNKKGASDLEAPFLLEKYFLGVVGTIKC